MQQWTAIVPVKAAVDAKSRLINHSATQRSALALAFAEDAISALTESSMIGRIIVVGADVPTGPRSGIEHAPDPGLGLNTAINHAALKVDPADPVLVMVADLPAVHTADIDMALLHASGHQRSIICDAAGTGTTALMRTGSTRLQPAFGPRSRAQHVASGAWDLSDLDVPGMRRDVDTEVDLWDALRLGVGPRTRLLIN